MARPQQARGRRFYRAAVERLRDEEFKLTPQREAILERLSGHVGHWTAQDLYTQLAASGVPSLSQATVYNTLELLEELGVLTRLCAEDGQTYFDRNVDPHHHAICVECGALIDVDVASSALASLASHSRGYTSVDMCFEIEVASVWFRGICTSCR